MRTITVKGTGYVKAAVDNIVISMSLSAIDLMYDTAMERAAEQLEQLAQSLTTVGFEKSALKTTNFHVSTEYSSEKDRYDNYKRIFVGYQVNHNLKLEFDFNIVVLANVLAAIGASPAKPELHIRFTVKDDEAINEELLRQATINARKKAEILCTASNVTLGDLQTVQYHWGELDIYSHTDYRVAEDCLMEPMMMKSMDITPDDIDVSDTVTFVWETK